MPAAPAAAMSMPMLPASRRCGARHVARFGAATGEPYLYGKFSAADAMFAPVATRLDTYDFAVQPDTAAYIAAIKAHPAFVSWLDAALREPWIVPSDEVDEEPTEVFRNLPN